jgi:hypothetical protein
MEPHTLRGFGLVSHEDGRPVGIMPFALHLDNDPASSSAMVVSGHVSMRDDDIVGLLQAPLRIDLPDGRTWCFEMSSAREAVDRGGLIVLPHARHDHRRSERTMDVDTSDGPALIRYVLRAMPDAEELTQLHGRLIREGLLTNATGAMVDLRRLAEWPSPMDLEQVLTSSLRQGAWPLRRALVSDPAQTELAECIRSFLGPLVDVAVFTDVVKAERWLRRR